MSEKHQGVFMPGSSRTRRLAWICLCLCAVQGLACSEIREAESGLLLGDASIYEDPAASNGQGVAYISAANSGFRMQDVPAASGFGIRYASELSGSLSVFVNGVFGAAAEFTSTGSWVGSYEFIFLLMEIPEGADLDIRFQEGDTAMNVDLIDFFSRTPSVPVPGSSVEAEPDESSLGRSDEVGAGLISVDGDVIVTRFAERFRDRHESDLNHDRFIEGYAQGSAYEVTLIDGPEALEVQVYSPDAPLSMVNLTHDHIVNPGFADPPQFRGGGFMAKGSPEGPADARSDFLVDRLFFEIRSTNGRPWSEVRGDHEIVTLELTPRRELNGQFPQYYSDIFRYRAGEGGLILEREDARYFSAGSATVHPHGTPGFEFSQPYLGIDQPSLHDFMLGRELFRARFLGDPLPGNGSVASGADPEAAGDSCVGCHFQLGKASPPGRGRQEQQGFIGSGEDLRVAPSLMGLGLLEAVDQQTIEKRALESGGRVPEGRFGWKASEPSLRSQIRKAFLEDLGVEDDNPVFLDRVEAYIRGLGVPVRRHPTAQAQQEPNVGLRVQDAPTILDPDVLDGESAFMDSDCARCHRPAMQTGSDHPVLQFRDITIRPFTDLLLWDMGPALCAESDEGSADRCEWRTAPLWGLRLQEQVTGHASFLHDGRATSLDEAIRLHGGEARSARERYEELPEDRRFNLVLYLKSL